MGAVISSTDAATVFSILRSRKLGLKNNSAPLLEVESGSNDPMSYMLTAVMLSLFSGGITAGGIVWQIFSQIVFGAAGGLVIATGAVFLLKRINFQSNGFDLLLFIAIALVSYAFPDLIGGNGYLSAYIVGIVLGNTEFPERKPLVSIALQGSLIPAVAKATGMTDSGEDVMTTFSDFSENSEMSFGAIRIAETSRWNNRQIKDLDLPQDCLIALVVRGNQRIVPKGNRGILDNGHRADGTLITSRG